MSSISRRPPESETAFPLAAVDWLPARHVTTLVNAIQELSLARDLDAVREVVRRAARRLTGADGATFILRDGDLCFYIDEDAISPLWKGQRFPMSNCVSGWAMEHRQPAVIEDIYSDPRVPVDAYRPTFVKSMVMVPIRSQAPIGAIGNYWARQHLATPEEIALLQALADSASIALENVDLYSGLERRVHERTLALEAANRDLEAFSYSVAHDLRAPLTILRGWADLLATESESVPPALSSGAAAVAEATDRMESVISGLLALASVGRKPLEVDSVDLTAVANSIVEELRKRDPDRAVEVEVASGVQATGDARLLRVALENLFGNAWKFTSGASPARIRFCADMMDGECVYSIADNGAGFDGAHASKLFTAFERLHAAADFEGTGIGLATVDRIIRRHGGRIWAEGVPGAGATFYFTLGSPAAG